MKLEFPLTIVLRDTNGVALTPEAGLRQITIDTDDGYRIYYRQGEFSILAPDQLADDIARRVADHLSEEKRMLRAVRRVLDP